MRTSWRSRSGQAAIMMCLSLTFLFSILGFSVDLGQSFYRKQAAQAAADSAAMAAAVYAKTNASSCGAGGFTCSSTPTSCSSITSANPVLYVGCQYANQNGFAMSAISMSANTGTPASAPGTSPATWIKATVATSNKNFFLRFAGFTTAYINAEATSGVVSSGGTGSGNCFVTLDPSGAGALFLTGQITLTLTNCSGQVNSSADDPVNKQPSNMAANANGQNTINGAINVKGGSASGNQVRCASPFVCGSAVIADPLVNLRAFNATTDLPASAPGGSGGTPCSSAYTSISSNTTITPGCYNGIHISGGTVTFQSGNYLMKGPLLIDNGTTTGTNVMFYMSSTNPSTTTDSLVTLNTSAITFSAPNSGTFKGMLFYGDRTAPADSPGNYNAIQAQSSPSITGTMYFPKGNIKLTGQAGISGYLAMIAYRIDLEAQSTFKWDSTGTYTGLASGGSTAYLIE